MVLQFIDRKTNRKSVMKVPAEEATTWVMNLLIQKTAVVHLWDPSRSRPIHWQAYLSGNGEIKMKGRLLTK